MKKIKLIGLLFTAIFFYSCDTIQKATNSTGGVFSLTGTWELYSNSPDNTLTGSRVTVLPLVSEGRFILLNNNTQCYRENDVKWKDIMSDNSGSFNISNLVSTCNTGSLNYKPAKILVVNANEIRVSGKNATGMDNMQVWRKADK